MAAGSHSYTVVGAREDLSDIITNISPTETPIFTMMGRATADSVKHRHLCL